MKRALLIAEKPSLMREIQSVYKIHKASIPYFIDFTAQAGHLITLMTPSEIDIKQKKWSWDILPFLPEREGGWKYKIIPDKVSLFNDIKNKINTGGYDFIIHAADPDPEGQLLCNLVLMYSGNKLPVKRFWTNDLTESAILDALMNLKDNDKDPFLINLGKASLARQHSDYKVGMNISPAASLKMKATCSIGRVKSPLLKIIVDRENDIANFKPTTTYELVVNYKEKFNSVLFNETGEDAGNVRFKTKEECEEFAKTLNNKAKVISVDKKLEKTSAPPLFKLATLQIEGAKYGFNADKVLGIAQSLYEKKYMSYPRTSCEFLASTLDFKKLLKSISVFPDLKKYADKVTDKDIDNIKKNKKYVNDAKLKESGHYALSPTTTVPDLSTLRDDEKLILELVFKQFMAMFLPPVIQDKTTIITDNKGSLFRVTGKILKDKGYTILYGTTFTDNQLPDIKKGDIVNVENFKPEEKTTTCPKRFSDGDLIQIMENPSKFLVDESLKTALKSSKGIGTPATRASILNQLIDKDKYVERKKGKGKGELIYATEKGIKVIEKIGDRSVFQVDLTAQWEEKLDDIKLGKLDIVDFEREMDDYIINLIEDLKTAEITSLNLNGPERTVIGKCPICGEDVIVTEKAYLCSKYKKDTGCSFGFGTSIAGKKITEKEAINILTKGKSSKLKFKNPKTKDSFETCLIYDEKEKKVTFDFGPKATNEIIGSCPICNKNVLDKGRFVSCESYKNGCDFAISYNIKEAELTKEDIKTILNGNETDAKKFSFGDAKLKYNKSTQKLEFIFNQGETIGKCPLCGKNVLDKGKFISCEDKECSFSISYNIKNVKLTKKDMLNLINDKNTDYKKFSFGEAQLKYNKTTKKLGFIFKNKK